MCKYITEDMKLNIYTILMLAKVQFEFRVQIYI